MPQEVAKNGKVKFELSIENVGFGNLVNKKVVTIVLKNKDKKYEIKTDLDATKWNSKQITKEILEIELPEEIELGEWQAYLRVSQYGDNSTDNNYQCIRFANNNIWEEELGANYIGKIVVTEAKIENNNTKDNNQENNKTENNDEKNNNQENNTSENNNEDNNSEKEHTSKDEENSTNNNKKPNINKLPNNSSEKENKDNTVANGKLPQTGEKMLVIKLAIIILSTFTLYFFIKICKSKEK